MKNYLKAAKNLKSGIDQKDYSLSNNNIGKEYKDLISRISGRKLLELVSRYPDYQYTECIKALKSNFGIDKVILGSGSEDLIIRINSVLKNNGGIGILFPTFYRIEETAGKYKELYTLYRRDSKFADIDFFSEQINRSVKALWILNPNPMIGKLYKREQLLKLIKNYSGILFIIDESAAGFIKDSERHSVIDIAQCVKNLIVIRSFSKLYSLAGLRIGFATGNTEILNKVKEISLTFPINGVAEYFIRSILKEKNVINRIRGKIEKYKLLIKNLLSQDPKIIFSKSATNCLFFGDPQKDIFPRLLKFGVLALKLDGHKGVNEKNFVRITIHSSEFLHNDLFSRLYKFIKSRN